MKSQAAHASHLSHTSYRYTFHFNDVGRRSCSDTSIEAGGLKRWSNLRDRKSWFSVQHHPRCRRSGFSEDTINPATKIPKIYTNHRMLIRQRWWVDIHRKSECERRICEWLSRHSVLDSQFPTLHCQRKGCEENTRAGTHIAAISIPWNENAACTITDNTPRNRSNGMLSRTRCARANTPRFFQYYSLLFVRHNSAWIRIRSHLEAQPIPSRCASKINNEPSDDQASNQGYYKRWANNTARKVPTFHDTENKLGLSQCHILAHAS